MLLKEFLKSNPPTNKFVFGQYLRICREESGKSLRVLAKELEVTASYLCDVENAKRYAPFKLLPKFMSIYGIKESEKDDFYDLAYLTHGKGFPDISDYLFKHPTALKAVRSARDKDLSGERFLEIVNKIIEEDNEKSCEIE